MLRVQLNRYSANSENNVRFLQNYLLERSFASFCQYCLEMCQPVCLLSCSVRSFINHSRWELRGKNSNIKRVPNISPTFSQEIYLVVYNQLDRNPPPKAFSFTVQERFFFNLLEMTVLKFNLNLDVKLKKNRKKKSAQLPNRRCFLYFIM